MQSLRKIVRAVFAGPKNTGFASKPEKPPLWHFFIRLIMQEEKVFRNFISFSLRSKEISHYEKSRCKQSGKPDIGKVGMEKFEYGKSRHWKSLYWEKFSKGELLSKSDAKSIF